MKLIEKDDTLFEILKNVEVRLLDSMVKRINIFIRGIEELCIEIDFDHRQYNGNYLRIRFLGIKEYSFYHNNTYYFGTVERFKLIKHDELFYLSLAPEDEFSTTVSDEDQDLVVCKSFEGYFIDK